MGDNYYLRVNEECAACRILQTKIHIGKCSYGWCFSLRVYPDSFIDSWEAWKSFLEHRQYDIVDAGGHRTSYQELIQLVENRKKVYSFNKPYPVDEFCSSWQERHESNGSISTPYGLFRRKLSSRVLSHGQGPWDCIEGVFE